MLRLCHDCCQLKPSNTGATPKSNSPSMSWFVQWQRIGGKYPLFLDRPHCLILVICLYPTISEPFTKGLSVATLPRSSCGGIESQLRDLFFFSIAFSYWKWGLIVGLPIKHGGFPIVFCVYQRVSWTDAACAKPRPRYWNCLVCFVKVAGGRQAMQRSSLGGRNWYGEF